MKVKNLTKLNLIAFCIDEERGYSKDHLVKPGDEVEIKGAYLGEMGGGGSHVHIEGDIICVDDPDEDRDDNNNFFISAELPLRLSGQQFGVTVRDESNEREKHTLVNYY